MGIFDSAILLDLAELPSAGLILLGGIGLLLWVTGWAFHRFWLTLMAAVIAGLIGLRFGKQWGLAQPVVSGLLMAAAGGCIALSLARVSVFCLFGFGALWLTQQFAPAYAIPIICVCVGGLFSVLCYGLCIRLLTAAVGTLFLVYSGLAVAHQFRIIDAHTILQSSNTTILASFGGVSMVGLIIQLAISRMFKSSQDQAAQLKIDTIDQLQQLGIPVKSSWWQKLRKAA